LRRRIFGVAERVSARTFHLADLSQWLVPVFGCFLLVMGTLSDRYPAHETLPVGFTNMLLSDNNAVISARADHSDKNALPPMPAEWTLGARSASARASTSALDAVMVSYTNKLIQ
jgi:hypothetical protein